MNVHTSWAKIAPTDANAHCYALHRALEGDAMKRLLGLLVAGMGICAASAEGQTTTANRVISGRRLRRFRRGRAGIRAACAGVGVLRGSSLCVDVRG